MNAAKPGEPWSESRLSDIKDYLVLADLAGGSYISGMSQLHRITFNANQCGGRPCIRGMRVRVKDVLDMLAGGAKEEEVLESYPDLQREDILAALEYAARQVDHAVVTVAK